MTVRILIVDDEALVRAGLRLILESNPDFAVVGELGDGADIVSTCQRTRPDVVLMDIRMPQTDGITATTNLQLVTDAPSVIILTTFDVDDYVFSAIEAGASGFLLKDTPPRTLVDAVSTVAAGGSILSPSVAKSLLDRFASGTKVGRRRESLDRLAAITAREHSVVVEIANGKSNAEIGTALFMSEATVKSHVSHLFEKLHVTNRVQVALLAYRAGLVD
jgi:DNA-binding NarL/FixJ family response regulator